MIEKKIPLPTVIEEGEKVLNPEVLEEILDELLGNMSKDTHYQKGYKSSSWLEPDDPAEMEIEVSATLALKDIEKKYILGKDGLELIEDALANADYYDFYETLVSDFISEMESDIPGYEIEDYDISFSLNKEKQRIELQFEVNSYSFDEYEYVEGMRPEPDPYDDF